MFNTLYLLNYNNYYNREFRKENSLSAYLEYEVATAQNYNFNPGDHISANIIVNIDDDITPDYLIVVDETNTILSHWFVIESTRIRSGQYNLTLYRDTMVDFYDNVINSPCFIEKAIVPEMDSAIYNSEEMTFNRIKTSETAIKDNTNTSWLVAYIARDDANTIIGEITPPNEVDITAERDTWEYANLLNGEEVNGNVLSSNFSWRFYNKTGFQDPVYLSVNFSRPNSDSTPTFQYSTAETSTYIASSAADMGSLEFNNTYFSTFASILDYLPTANNIVSATSSQINNILALDNATIRFTGENKIYKIKINSNVKTIEFPESATATIPNGDIIYTFVQSKWSDVLTYTNPQSAIARGRFYNYKFTYTAYTMTLEEQGTTNAISYSVPLSRIHLEDAPYDMICTPYENIDIQINDTTITSYTSNVIAVFSDMARKYAGGDAPLLYDVQRLPYCPIPALETVNNVLQTSAWNGTTQMFPITSGDTTIGAIFGCKVSNFTNWIPLENPIAINNKKIQSQCDMYRICSPNYNGMFEFDPAMNNGLTGFNIYCTYKPFNPYIQVSPNFSGLYGSNFNDSRGLICGGEWSMPIVTDAWETYERQNANYQNSFNRQIENMKITQKVQREQEVWSVIAGAMQGGVSGAAAGLFMGGGLQGAIAGGLGGGLISAIGGARDIALNNLLRNEAIDYAQDQFGYQLGNIQALPNSLARTSAFTINNKVFPFLEYYTCTTEEKEALANKIAQNGMTVMRIGKIKDYIDNSWTYGDITARNYIKGKIIKCEGLNDEYHIAKTISNELNKGIYFGG